MEINQISAAFLLIGMNLDLAVGDVTFMRLLWLRRAHY